VRSADTGALNVLFLGRISQVKRLDLLVQAWPAVFSQVGRCRLLLAGPEDDGTADELRRLLASMDVGDSVEFVGSVRGPVKRELLHSARVLVLVSEQESLGLAGLEALAAGVPLVLSRGVPYCERVAARGAAIILSRSDSRCLSEALVTALVDDEWHRHAALAARELAAEEFSMDRHVAQLLGLARQVRRGTHLGEPAGRDQGAAARRGKAG
jgi:glycosyltransferase involved in cell wall biosynthesis